MPEGGSNQFSKLSGRAVVYAVRLVGNLSGAKKPIDPSEIFAYRSFARDVSFDLALIVIGIDVINEAVSPQVDAVFPEARLHLAPFHTERGGACGYLQNGFSSWSIYGHNLISTSMIRAAQSSVLMLR